MARVAGIDARGGWLAWKLPDDVWDGLGLEQVGVEGYRTFVLPGDEFADREPSGVRLLSHYDVYVVACHPRDHLIPEQKERVFFRGAGVWRRTQRGRRVELLVEAFRRLTKAQQGALADDARRVAGTVGAEPVLELA